MITNLLRKVMPTYGYSDRGDEIIGKAIERAKFSPDISKLMEYEWQLIFAIDCLKKDHTKHHLLGQDRQKLFPAFTQRNYQYWESADPTEHRIPMSVNKDEPVIRRIVGMPPVAKIKGEVFAIRPENFLELDPLYQNTVQFHRERIRVVVPYRKVLWLKDKSLWPAGLESDPEFLLHDEHCHRSIVHSRELTCIVRAWMYTGSPAFWDPLLSTFNYDAAEHHHSNKRRWCETFYNIRRPPPPRK